MWESTIEQLQESYDVLLSRLEREDSPIYEVPVLIGKKFHFYRLRADHGLPSMHVEFVNLATFENFMEMVVPFAESLDEVEKVRLRYTKLMKKQEIRGIRHEAKTREIEFGVWVVLANDPSLAIRNQSASRFSHGLLAEVIHRRKPRNESEHRGRRRSVIRNLLSILLLSDCKTISGVGTRRRSEESREKLDNARNDGVMHDCGLYICF